MNGERETPREIARGGPRLARTCLLGPPSFTRDRMPAYLIRFLTRCIRGCLHRACMWMHTFSPGLRCSCHVMNHHRPVCLLRLLLLRRRRSAAPRSSSQRRAAPSRVESSRSVAVAVAVAVAAPYLSLVPRPPFSVPQLRVSGSGVPEQSGGIREGSPRRGKDRR